MSRIPGRTKNIDATDEMPKCQFGGIIIPVESIKISGGIRNHVHEFPHQAGGAPEKLGRSLYRVTLVGLFHTTFAGYAKLYPESLQDLVKLFEFQTTKELLIPTHGTIDAFALKWDREWVAKIRSGEKMTMEFLEDQGSQFTLEAIASPAVADNTTAMAITAEIIKANMAADELAKFTDLFTGLQNLVNSLAAIEDQAGIYSNYIEAKLNQINNMCQTIDGLGSMNDPKNWAFVDELHQLAQSTIGKLADLHDNRVELQTFIVPMTMDVGMVSAHIWGNTQHVDDLLSLNAIDNPLRIKAGTSLRFYP